LFGAAIEAANAKTDIIRILIVDCPWNRERTSSRQKLSARAAPLRQAGNANVSPALSSSTGRAFVIAWRSDIEGEILANLPDQSDKAGYGCALTEFLPVENLSRSPNRHRTF
jgi:hypothetical protein